MFRREQPLHGKGAPCKHSTDNTLQPYAACNRCPGCLSEHQNVQIISKNNLKKKADKSETIYRPGNDIIYKMLPDVKRTACHK